MSLFTTEPVTLLSGSTVNPYCEYVFEAGTVVFGLNILISEAGFKLAFNPGITLGLAWIVTKT